MTTSLVSILVPVYNVEKYIENCARSIFEQSYEHLDIVFYDDCSSDNSIGVIKKLLIEFPHRQAQVTFCHNAKNLGLAATRKKAYDIAKGKYLVTLDSDDWLELNTCQCLVNLAEKNNVDIVFFDFYINKHSCMSYQSMRAPENASEFIAEILKNSQNASLCNKFIKRDFFLQAAVSVPDYISIGEDFCVTLQLLFTNPAMLYANQAFYHYRMNENSMTHQRNVNFFEKELLMVYYIDSILQTETQRRIFYETKAKIKLQIIGGKVYPRNIAYTLFPEISKGIWRLETVPFMLRLALFCFSIKLSFGGLIFMKTNHILHRLKRKYNSQ